jgi:excisionase family DNA binding protein
MPRTKAKTSKHPKAPAAATNDVAPAAALPDVMNLDEAAAYLRVTPEDVLSAVRLEKMPGKQVGQEWRFLKSAVNEWLRTPHKLSGKEALLAFAGAWENDPHIEEMLRDIYKARGRPMTEDEK